MEPFLGRLRRVVLGDAGLRLDHLGQGPEGRSGPVRERAALAPVGELVARADRLHQLVDEPALADAGNADERHELRRPLLACATQGVPHGVELGLAADERRAGAVEEVDTESGTRRSRLPHDDRPLLALDQDRRRRLVLNRLRGGAIGRLVDEDAVHRRCRLEPRSGVDDVSARHSLALGHARSDADERLTGRDRDPELELRAFGEDCLSDRERRTYGALRIVLVRDRRAEERHHRVADELLHGATEALELGS